MILMNGIKNEYNFPDSARNDQKGDVGARHVEK